MFAYGICAGTSGKLERIALPALLKFCPDSPVLLEKDSESIFKAYNRLLDQAKLYDPPLEGLILLHDDTEILENIETALREAFSKPDVAVVGAVGGVGLRSVSWSRARKTFGIAPDIYHGQNDHGGGSHAVDTVDGLLLALSPWAIENLRFDETRFTGFHAYDADICMQAKAMGKFVRVEELKILHHTKGGFGDIRRHRISDDAFRRKWSIPLDNWLYRLSRRLRNLNY
jgi:hypothetical protein